MQLTLGAHARGLGIRLDTTHARILENDVYRLKFELASIKASLRYCELNVTTTNVSYIYVRVKNVSVYIAIRGKTLLEGPGIKISQ